MWLCQTLSIVLVSAVLSVATAIEPVTTPPLVKTKSGDIQGSFATSFLDRRTFFSFRGIPYAKPPIGPLRFKAPQKLEPWTGVWNASQYGAQCLQNTMDLKDFIGDENCLFLNVYTPNLSGPEKLPVIFYIHGGGFNRGSGDSAGPEILLDEDVVLVTINYRLGPFGFLSLNLPEYSGNMGLKDQLVALKWVNENIESFGGDRNQITIYGESAGGISVHFHTLFPASRNLFQRAISSSGTVLNLITLTRNYTEIIRKLIAKEKNVNENDVQSRDVVEWVKVVNDKRLGVDTFSPMIDSSKPVKKIDLHWGPVYEKDGDVDAILTRPIESYLQDKSDVDTLFGYNSAESIRFETEDLNSADKLKSFDENFAVQLPFLGLNYTYFSPEYNEIMKEVREFYFGDKPVNRDTLQQYVRLLDDVFFVYGIDKSARAQAARSTKNTFYYQFSLESELNFMREEANASALGLRGATHVDDLFYLFKMTVLVPEGGYEKVKPGTKEAQLIRMMTKFIIDFANNGNPAPNSKPAPLKPIQGNVVNFVDITNDGLIAGVNPHIESVQFWNGLLSKYKESLQLKF